MAVFEVFEKNLSTESVKIVKVFPSLKQAQDWVENMSDIWEEERAYKIVKV